MRDGLQLEANFVPFAEVKGRYRGLIARTSDRPECGLSFDHLSRTGAFTLDQFGGKKTLRGAFNSSGSFTGAITRKSGAAIDVQLHIDAVEGQQQISGSLNVDGATFTLAAGRKTTNKSTSRAARYAVILADGAGDEDHLEPSQDNGFAVIVVSTTGEARVTGTLADGTAFAAGGSLSENGSLPLHVSIAGGNTLIGVLAFGSGQPLESVAGTLHWVTPDARFRRKITALGSRIIDQ